MGLVVATRIELQLAEQLAGSGVENANVSTGDEELDRPSLGGPAEADVVEL